MCCCSLTSHYLQARGRKCSADLFGSKDAVSSLNKSRGTWGFFLAAWQAAGAIGVGCLGCIPPHHSWQNKSFHKVFTTCSASSPQEIQPPPLLETRAGPLFAAPLSQIKPVLTSKHSATKCAEQHLKIGRQWWFFLLPWVTGAAKSLSCVQTAPCYWNLLSSSALKPQLGLGSCSIPALLRFSASYALSLRGWLGL